MKNHFKEYYSLSSDDVSRIWNGDYLLVLDTNVLLNPYRYSKETSDQLFAILESLKDKLWIPYQVGWEYQNNRMDVYYANWSAAERLENEWNTKMEEFKQKTQSVWYRNPFANGEDLDKAIATASEAIHKDVDKWKQGITDYLDNDPIRDRITELYIDKVGEDFSEEELQKLYKEGEKRFKDHVPPGYEDDTAKKRAKGLRHVFGDLIAWKQIIKKAAEEKRNIIFISGDQKEDWWEVWHGKKLRPRVELIKEFYDATGQDIMFYTQPKFMEYAKANLGLKTTEKSIEEVEAVNKADAEEKKRSQIKLTEEILANEGIMPRKYVETTTSGNEVSLADLILKYESLKPKKSALESYANVLKECNSWQKSPMAEYLENFEKLKKTSETLKAMADYSEVLKQLKRNHPRIDLAD